MADIMKKLLYSLSFIILFFTSCMASSGTKSVTDDNRQEVSSSVVFSDHGALNKPVLDSAYFGNTASGLNDFSLRLALETRKKFTDTENYIISPLGVAVDLAMTIPGAAGKTREEILDVLGHLREETLDSLDRLLSLVYYNLNHPAVPGSSSLHTSFWINKGFKVKKSFIESCTEDFDASVYVRKLSSVETMNEINRWVEVRTNGLIKQLLDDPLNEVQMTALLNTIYVKGKWDKAFDTMNTRKEKFHNLNGTDGECDMMQLNDEGFDVVRFDKFNIIRFPLDSTRYGLDIVYPHPGVSLGECLPQLDGEIFTDWDKKAIRVSWNIIKMPKWEIETELFFSGPLINIGVKQLFDVDADLSGITDVKPFYVDEILQKAKFIVDEQGAEAAAATIEIMLGGTDFEGRRHEPSKLILDRPFMYILTDTRTNTITFIGEIRNFQQAS